LAIIAINVSIDVCLPEYASFAGDQKFLNLWISSVSPFIPDGSPYAIIQDEGTNWSEMNRARNRVL
jgi:hypothetical protein